jgi:NAD(P)-dependent dehydrogenase (short-subunit alcohol dehydrogenase family)
MLNTDHTHELDGKVILVTGATAGVGEVTARTLAGMGATLVLVARSPEKCRQVADEIKGKTGNPRVSYLVGDLSAQADVRRLAGEFKQQFTRLDVLVNNAGAVFLARRESVDGIEMTFALNHLAYFLLTNLLLDVLVASAPARIISVSSAAHRGAQLNFEDLENKKGWSGWRAYGQSKLANLLFTNELARRLEGKNVTANALHPGFVASNFAMNNLGILKGPYSLVQKVVAISPEAGAQTSIYLASSPQVQGATGQYFDKKQAVEPSPAAHDLEAARRLWEISARMTGLPAPLL